MLPRARRGAARFAKELRDPEPQTCQRPLKASANAYRAAHWTKLITVVEKRTNTRTFHCSKIFCKRDFREGGALFEGRPPGLGTNRGALEL